MSNVLDNDLLNGVAVIPSEVVISALSDPADGVTLNILTGEVTVAPGTPAGTYFITYQICEVLNPTNCDPALVTVVVSATPIVANDDDASLTPVNGYTGGTAVNNVLDNDLLNGVAVIPSEVVISALSDPADGVTLDILTGAVSVAPGTPAGTYFIEYQICEVLNPTNCDPALVTVVVYECPTILTEPSGTAVCANGTHTMNVIANSGSGTIAYQWQISSSGCGTGFNDISGATNSAYTTPPLTVTSYYRCLIYSTLQYCPPVQSSCATVVVNPLPTAIITPNGPTTFCQGGSVVLTASGGTGYLWSNAATTAAITVSASGTYTVTVTNANGCSDVASVPVTVNPLPISFNVTGTGSYCIGQPGLVVGLSGSQTGVEYTLVPGGAVLTGTGSAIYFNAQPAGVYTITARNLATNCTSFMSGSATVTTNPKPSLVVTNPSSVCEPGTVNITDPAVTAGSSLFGATLSYWLDADALLQMPNPATAGAGIYYIKATTNSGCFDIKPVTVVITPKPILVTNPQSVCSPARINLTAPAVTAGSTLYGATLSYWINAAATIPMPNPTVAGNGTYYIKATTAGGCFDIKPVTVTINPLPTVYLGTGGGSYCEGGSGMILGISGSQIGVNYSLWIGVTQVSPIIPGTGAPISFGLHALAGHYWVLAENTTTYCINRMYDCVEIVINPSLPVSVAVASSANPVTAGSPVTFTASPVNEGTLPTYQWKVNGFNVGTNLPTFTYIPVNHDVVSCVLTSNLPCASGNPATSNAVVMTVGGVSPVITVTGNVAVGESKCYNAAQTLTVAGGGTTFTVNSGGTTTMIAGQNIIYMQGTIVKPGGYMHGYISTIYCGQKAASIVEAPAGEGEIPVTAGKSTFKLYPNPTSGNFTLEQTGEKVYDKVKVEVFGMRGERVMTGEIVGEKKHEFFLSDLPHGLYFVKLIAEGYVETFKLVKTR